MSSIRPIVGRLALVLATGLVSAVVFFVALESRSFVRYSLTFSVVASAIFGLVVIIAGALSVIINEAFPGSRFAAVVSHAVDPLDDSDD